MKAYHKENKMPDKGDLEPGTGYCWWFNQWAYAWELGDLSWADSNEWWMPYNEIPDPTA